MTYLLYFTALSLSAVAAYYSIAGLAAIFAAAVIPIVLMGSVLEFAKLVVASWLYRSWKSVPILMRSYFVFALVILMTLTSMGIFGFLSKAHLDQAVPTGDVASKVAILDEKIKTEKDNIDAARNQLKQMDAQVDQTLSRTTDDKGAERSLQIRRGQQKERSTLLADIGSAQTRISRLNEERAPIAAELRKVEAEVGPLKYVAALLYGDNLDATLLEKAVRFVIIMIVIVFDPLAVLMLIAVNQSTMRRNHGPEPTKEEESVEAKDPIVITTKEDEEPISFTYTVPEGSAQITSTSTQHEETRSESELPIPNGETSGSESASGEQPTSMSDVQSESMPVQSGSEAGTTEESVAEVPFIDNTEVKEIVPVPLGPLAQELRGGSQIQEVLDKPTSGRPERFR